MEAKILVFSDTHGMGRKIITQTIKEEKPNIVVHCGDHCFDKQFMDKTFNYYVKGNMDDFGPELAGFTVDGKKFLIMHGHQIGAHNWKAGHSIDVFHNIAKKKGADVLLYGHSHRYSVDTFNDGIVVLNPGSIPLPYNEKRSPTCMILNVKDGDLYVTEREFLNRGPLERSMAKEKAAIDKENAELQTAFQIVHAQGISLDGMTPDQTKKYLKDFAQRMKNLGQTSKTEEVKSDELEAGGRSR